MYEESEKRIALLENILKNVNDWLKFAEAKNAIIIGFNGATTWALIKILSENSNSGNYILFYYLISFIICLIISTIIALLSFQPELAIFSLINTKDELSLTQNDNLLFFGSIKKFNSSEKFLLELFPNINKDDFSMIEDNYSRQIIINSKIASQKYYCFNIALEFTLSGILTPLWLVIFIIDFTILSNKNKKNI